jgi:hypothetical protein
MQLDKFKSEAQSVLDDLLREQLIPFQLTAHKVESLGMDEYIIRFNDNRIHSVDISSNNPRTFRDSVRVAVLARVGRMSGPLHKAAGKV